MEDLCELGAIHPDTLMTTEIGRMSVATGCPIELTQVIVEGSKSKNLGFGAAVAAALHYIHLSNPGFIAHVSDGDATVNDDVVLGDDLVESLKKKSSIGVEACLKAIVAWRTATSPQQRSLEVKKSKLPE